jgi:ferrous iron transport protein B
MFFTYSAFASGALAGAVMLTALLIVSVAATLLCGRLLSRTLLKGEQSSFTLELPPFRMPRVGRLIVRSVVDRTLFVLGRAAAVAAPAGLLLYCAAGSKTVKKVLDNLCGWCYSLAVKSIDREKYHPIAAQRAGP